MKVTEGGVVASKLVLPKEVKVIRRNIVEYAQALRGRYFRASREDKGKMLDEFTKVAALHSKAAIRLLNRPSRSSAVKRRGRPATYKDVIHPLKVIWEASDRVCSKRLQPFIPEMKRVLRQHNELGWMPLRKHNSAGSAHLPLTECYGHTGR